MFSIYGITNTGRVRCINEDALLINGKIISSGDIYIEETDEVFVAVADGMGGEEAGEVASKLTLVELKSKLYQLSEKEIEEDVKIINRKVLDGPSIGIGKVGMGSTLVAFKIQNENNVLINIGDSRGYFYRDGFLRQLTKDHTLVQQLYEAGCISREEIKNHSKSHLLTQCIGANMNSLLKPQVILNKKFIKDDIILLCSDGLHNKIDEDGIEDIISLNNDIKDIGKNLIATANDLGGEDNISLVLVKVMNIESDKYMKGENHEQ